jgi:predicted transcriptional regulator
MSTTSLKLSEELKQRAATAAQELGVTTDAFMVEAIRQAADAVEQRSQFVADALAAREEMLKSGMGHDADDVSTYLRDRIKGSQPPRPAAKPWRK